MQPTYLIHRRFSQGKNDVQAIMYNLLRRNPKGIVRKAYLNGLTRAIHQTLSSYEKLESRHMSGEIVR